MFETSVTTTPCGYGSRPSPGRRGESWQITISKKAGSSIRPFAYFIVGETSRRLHQAFLGESFLDHRAGADAGLVGQKIRQTREVEFHPVGPGQHGEEVAVCNREVRAHPIIAAAQLAGDILKLAHHQVLEQGL